MGNNIKIIYHVILVIYCFIGACNNNNDSFIYKKLESLAKDMKINNIQVSETSTRYSNKKRQKNLELSFSPTNEFLPYYKDLPLMAEGKIAYEIFNFIDINNKSKDYNQITVAIKSNGAEIKSNYSYNQLNNMVKSVSITDSFIKLFNNNTFQMSNFIDVNCAFDTNFIKVVNDLLKSNISSFKTNKLVGILLDKDRKTNEPIIIIDRVYERYKESRIIRYFIIENKLKIGGIIYFNNVR